MSHAPKKKLLPEDIEKKPDGEVAEQLFGEAAKRELDRLIDAPEKSIPKE